MPLQNPVAIYAANTNQEALLLQTLLNNAGIEANVTEDLSLVGTWFGGTAPNIHRPKVWVDQSQEEAASAMLRDFEQKRLERSEYAKDLPANTEPVEATCEECGTTSEFPGAQRGSVQACPKCGSSMDVGAEDEEEWWKVEGEEGEPTEE
jgi:Zn finger protein HypA/HybF involved in hydrogenase expression